MVGQSAGPSRRSHTKSRKGCKTCKRRHIRCDETFPQCRNCTKHQVRCDYMETMGSDAESQASPEQTSLCFTPRTEGSIDLWQQTGVFPYPELGVFPVPQSSAYTKNELRLIHHLTSISNGLKVNGASHLTIWAAKIPKFLSIASTYPYVMQALLSFSANHLAWTHTSNELRNLHIHHGTIALSELHNAIGSFSHSNADAVLAASLLLLWQATDWRSWSSLRSGIQSVLSAMQPWRQDSVFADFMNEEDLFGGSYRMHRRSSSVDSTDRHTILANVMQALHRLQSILVRGELEGRWINELAGYIQQLQSTSPAQTPDEQMNHLYRLRKWLFWVPIQLLEKQGSQGPATLALAHFYATALAIEPLFPDLGSSFCARAALSPLEGIISVTDALQTKHGMTQTSQDIASLMQFPRQTALSFKARAVQTQAYGMTAEPGMMSVDPETLLYTSIGNLSPAFAPSPLHYTRGHTPSNSSSSFLEVPGSSQSAGFSYGTQSWGAMPSPGFPPPMYTTTEDQVLGYGNDAQSYGGFHGGTPYDEDPEAGSSDHTLRQHQY